MARTTEGIYNSIIQEISTYSVLNGIVPVPDDFQRFTSDVTSSSKVGVARHIIWSVSYAIHSLEVIYDAFEAVIRNIANTAVPQTDRWMQQETLKFQHGDPLVWDGKRYGYTTIDDTKRIVTQCAIVTVGGKVLIKVAKGVIGSLEPLTVAEQTSLTEYWRELRPSGTNFGVVSDVADSFKTTLKIYFDPLVLNPDGTLISDGSTKPVDDAIKKYLQSLPFNGRYWNDQLVDSIQLAQGVISVDLDEASAKRGALSYSQIDAFYDAFAGYMELDEASSTISYISA